MSRKGQTPMSVFGPAGRLKGRMRYAPTLPAGEAAIPNDDQLAINITLLHPSIHLLKRCGEGSESHLFTRNDQKEVCSPFGSPETTKKRFAAISGRLKRPKSSLQPFQVTRYGSDGRKCHFMRHETAPTAGNVISCDMKRLRRSEMPFRAT